MEATMFSRLALVVALALGSAALLAAQQSDSPEPYNDDEAYRVYDVLLPHDSSPNTLVVQQETIGPLSREGSASLGPENCLTPAAASEFKDAILDYNRNNQKKSLLQRKFSVSRPYEILDAGTLNAMFQHPDGWNKFYQRFPNSGGIYNMSAVGFNRDKTRALVYFGSGCQGQCGDWSFRLLEKVNGKWEQAGGVTCHTAA
jgi:hypothetical protein